MRLPVTLIAAALVLASLLWAVRLAVDPEPVDAAPAAILAVEGLVMAVIAAVGLLVARGRWSRWLAGGLAVAWLGLWSAMPADGLGLVVLGVTAVVLVGATGPWLGGWLRRLPSAEGPEPLVVAIVLGILALPAVTALGMADGMQPAGWVLVGLAAATALALSRASMLGVWSARLALPLAASWAALAAGLPGGLVVAIAGGAATWGAWTGRLRLAVRPLAPPTVERVPFPPELVPPQILEAAGYDDAGRPLEDER